MKKSFLSFAAVVCAALFVCTADAGAQVVKLFNGKDLSNWNLFVDKGGASAQEVYTVKDGVIEVQGDHVERVMAALQKLGHKVKRAGG